MRLIVLVSSFLLVTSAAKGETFEDFLTPFLTLSMGVADAEPAFVARVENAFPGLKTKADPPLSEHEFKGAVPVDWQVSFERRGEDDSFVYMICTRLARETWKNSTNPRSTDIDGATRTLITNFNAILAELSENFDVKIPRNAEQMLWCTSRSSVGELNFSEPEIILDHLSKIFGRVEENGAARTGPKWEVLALDSMVNDRVWLHSFYLIAPVAAPTNEQARIIEPGFYFIAFQLAGQS